MNGNYSNDNISNNLYMQNQNIANNNSQEDNIVNNTSFVKNNIQNDNYDKITLYDLNSPKPIENMPYIFCPACKNKVIADSNFCSNCGNQISRR